MLTRMGPVRIAVQSDDTEDDIAPGERAGRNRTSCRINSQTEATKMSKWDVIEPHRQVDGLAAKDGETFQILVWNQQYDQYAKGSRDVEVIVAGLDGWSGVRLAHYRIDAIHSNAEAVWKALGKPDWPSDTQIAAMKEKEGLEKLCPDQLLSVEGSLSRIRFSLPVHAVSLLIGHKE